MKQLAISTFLSVLATPALVYAETGGAGGSHPVAPEPHSRGIESARAPRTPEPPPAASEEVDPETQTQWYGWQTLSLDAAAVLLAFGASGGTALSEAAPLMGATSLGTYALGAPITHLAHDNPGRAIGSLLLRGGLPIAFGAAGVGIEDCPDGGDFCGLSGALYGGLVGALTAVVVDATLLSYEEVPVEESALPNIGLAVDPRGAALVVGGRF